MAPTAPRNFSLVDLIPQPDTFTDKDGSQYDVRPSADFSASDLAMLTRLQKRVSTQATGLQSDDDDASAKAATALDQAVNDLFTLVVPTLPIERRDAVALNMKMAFLNWWQAQQPVVESPKAQKAAPRLIRGRPSRASSDSTD